MMESLLTKDFDVDSTVAEIAANAPSSGIIQHNNKTTPTATRAITTTSQKETETKFSLKQLRSNLKENLKRSGVLDTVKAQIRQEFINSLTLKQPLESRSKPSAVEINDRIIYSCLYFFLKNRKLINTISVFIAECGLDPKYSLLSESDLIQVIKLNSIRQTYERIKQGSYSGQYDYDLQPLVEKKRTSILDIIMFYCLSNGADKSEVSIQTDMTSFNTYERLQQQLDEIRKKDLINKENQLLQPNKTIEERMIKFQRDCEDRMHRDVQLQVQSIRENELTRVRLEEMNKHRLEMEAMRKSIDAEYQRRLQLHINRETESAQRLSEQEHSMQRQLYEMRQQMQHEIDELRSRENASFRKAELESQGIRQLELRLKEAQGVIESREKDIIIRERKLEETQANVREIARNEALQSVQAELDILSRERTTLLLDKKRFEDERATQSALVEAASSLRQQLKLANDKLLLREEEIDSLNRSYQRANAQRQEEERRVTEMVTQVDPSFSKFSKTDQVIALIRRNADLEVKLASYQDASKLEDRLNKSEAELNDMKSHHRELRVKYDTEKQQAQYEIEQLKRSLAAEKSRTTSTAHRTEELNQLVIDKSRTIESLRKQLDSQKNRVRMTGASSGYTSAISRGVGGTTTGNSAATMNAQRMVAAGGGQYTPATNVTSLPQQQQQSIDELSDTLMIKIMQKMGGFPQFQGVPAGTSYPVAATTTDAETASAKAITDAKKAALELQQQQAEQLNAQIQKEQQKAAELKAVMEKQQLETAHLQLRIERERLEAQSLERERAQAAALETKRQELELQAQKIREQQQQQARIPLSPQVSGMQSTSATPPIQRPLDMYYFDSRSNSYGGTSVTNTPTAQSPHAQFGGGSGSKPSTQITDGVAAVVVDQSNDSLMMSITNDEEFNIMPRKAIPSTSPPIGSTSNALKNGRNNEDDKETTGAQIDRELMLKQEEEDRRTATELNRVEQENAKKEAERVVAAAEVARVQRENEEKEAERVGAAAEAARVQRENEEKEAERVAAAAEAARVQRENEEKEAERVAAAAAAAHAAALKKKEEEDDKAREEAKLAAERRAAEEAEAKAAAEAAAAEAERKAKEEEEAEKKRKEVEDIQAAREKVKQRRREKQLRDSGSSLPSTPGGAGDMRRSGSGVAASLSSLPSEADSLDAFQGKEEASVADSSEYYPTRGRAAARNLGNNRPMYSMLNDSDSDEKMEVGGGSDESNDHGDSW